MSPETLQSCRPGRIQNKNCENCKTTIEYSLPSLSKSFKVKCFSCSHVSEATVAEKNTSQQKSASTSQQAQQQQQQQKKRNQGPNFSGFASSQKLGSDETPADMSYYELLGVEATATNGQIKKAYYVKAMKFHPDKNKDDPKAEEKFKEISEAYQTLYDPDRRAHYNQYGKSTPGENTFMDAEEFFKQQFGGDKFVDFIGEISIGKDFKDAMSAMNKEDAGPNDGSIEAAMSSEERMEVRQGRVGTLSDKLKTRLSTYAEAFPDPTSDGADVPIGTSMEDLATIAMEQFRKDATAEADILKDENYGVELLNSIGYTYELKASQYLAHFDSEDGPIYKKIWGFSMKGYGQFREKAHIIGETVGTFRSAIDLQKKFTELQEMEKKKEESNAQGTEEMGIHEQERRQRLEAEAANKGMETLWRGSKLEVESVVREVCDKVLEDTLVTPVVRRRRAEALQVLGSVFSSVKSEKELEKEAKKAAKKEQQKV